MKISNVWKIAISKEEGLSKNLVSELCTLGYTYLTRVIYNYHKLIQSNHLDHMIGNEAFQNASF